MSGPLVVEPEQGPEAWSNLEGAGVVSSWADVGTAVGKGAGFETAFSLAAAGLDTLGTIADPFRAVAGSAIGYLIEHISFLREPLDALAGDPREITAQAGSWHNASVELAEVAAGFGRTAGTAGWEGAAGEAQHAALETHAALLSEASQRCDELAGLLVGTGAAVGTVRALVRDLIADFLAWLLAKFLAWAMSAALTGGVTLLAAIGWVVWDAVLLAGRIADRLGRLLTTLAEAGGTAGRIADGMLGAAARARAVAPEVHRTAAQLDEVFGSVPAAEVTEAGKQFSKAEPVGKPGELVGQPGAPAAAPGGPAAAPGGPAG